MTDYGPHWYILDDKGNPVLEPDVLKAAQWLHEHPAEHWLCQTEVFPGRTYRWPRMVDDSTELLGWTFEVVPDNGALVSTVFLSLDHNHSGHGPPVLWETMIFGIEMPDGDEYDFQHRYRSVAEAVKGHARAVAVAQRVIQEQLAKAKP